MERERLARLKQLVRELERLPPSHARDILLRDARSRAVALETGDGRDWHRWAGRDDREQLRQRLRL